MHPHRSPICDSPRRLRVPLLALALCALAYPGARAATTAPTAANASYGPYARNVLDFWKAPSATPTPVVIYLHAGGFTTGDKSSCSEADLQTFRAAGVSYVSINYRYLNGPTVPIQDVLRDCARAVQYVRSRAADWNINPHRVAAYGNSAGALAALWFATAPDLAAPSSPDPILRQSSRLVCMGGLNGQFSGDVEQWRAEFGNDKVEAYGSIYKQPSVYGYSARADLFTPAGTALRQGLDMYSLLSASTPPLFIENTYPDIVITDLNNLLHHPRHARLIYDRARTLGVPVVGKVAALAIAPAPGDPTLWTAFALKYLSRTAPGEFVFAPAPVPAAFAGQPYPAHTFAVSGGSAPYRWSVASGSLPPGLALSSAGVLSGTPVSTGNYTFTLRATDSTSGFAERAVNMAVVAAAQGDLRLREDFEAYAVGAAPAAAWRSQASVMDGASALGSGRALLIHDASATAVAGYEANIASGPADQAGQLRIRFSLRDLAPAQTEPGVVRFVIGRHSPSTDATLHAVTASAFALEFDRDGTLRLRVGGVVRTSAFATYDRAQPQRVEIFANDHESEPVSYTQPGLGASARLGPNRVAVFINNRFFTETDLQETGPAGDATLGRLGFHVAATDLAQVAVDDLYVGPIPPPFELVDMMRTETGLALIYGLPSGHLYQLEYSETLASEDWTPRGAPVPGPADGSPHTFLVELPARAGFFRVRQNPP